MIDDVNGAWHGVPRAINPAPSKAPTPQTKQFVDHATKSAHDDWHKSTKEYEHAARQGSRNQSKLKAAMIDKAAVYEYWLQQKLRIDKLTDGNSAVKRDVKQINTSSSGDRYENGISRQITGQAQSTVLGETAAHSRTEVDLANSRLAYQRQVTAQQDRAAIGKIPLQLRRAEPDMLPAANQAVAQAQQDYANAVQSLQTDLIAESGLPANFNNKQLQAALGKMKTLHQGENLDGFIDSMGVGLQIKAKLNGINPNDPKLSPAERTLATTDPVTLAFLQASGVSLKGTLSPEMAKIAQENPAVFAMLAAHGANIWVNNSPTSAGAPGAASGGALIGSGQYLHVAVNGKELSLTSDQVKNFQFCNTLSVPEGGGLGNFGLGLVRQLNFGPASLPDNVKALMLNTDVVRTEYAGTRLGELMKQAPASNSSGAADYMANTVNPFLNTQLNGFFSLEARQSFWANNASSQVMPYMTSAIAVPPPSGEGPYPNLNLGFIETALTGAAPEEASALIRLMESQTDSFVSSFGTGSRDGRSLQDIPIGNTLFMSTMSKAVQIADLQPGAPEAAAANQAADWLLSRASQGVQTVGMWTANGLFEDVRQGNDDLAHALQSQYTGGAYDPYGTKDSYPIQLGNIIDNINNGEQYHIQDTLNGMNASDFENFEKNKSQLLNSYFGSFQSTPYIGTAQKITSDTQLIDLIGTAYGFTPSDTAAAKSADFSKNWFAGNASNMAVIAVVMDWIHKEGGENPTVTAVPLVYAVNTAGFNGGAIFEIAKPDGSQEVIDGNAAVSAVQANQNQKINSYDVDFKWHYTDFTAYEEQNQFDDSGHIYLYTDFLKNPGKTDWSKDEYAAHITTWQEHAQKWGALAAGSVVLVGGILFAPVTAGGSLTASAAAGAVMLDVGITASVALSANHLQELNSGGESISFANPEARAEWLNIGGSVASFVPLGATAKVAEYAGYAGSGVGLWLGGEQTVSLAQNWDQMSAEDQSLGLLSLGLDAGFVRAGFMSPKVAEETAAYTGGKDLMPRSPGELEVWNGNTGRSARTETLNQADNVRYVAVTNDGVALMLRRGQPIPPDFHGARVFAVGPDGTAVQLRSVADLPPAAGGGEAAAPYTGGRIFAVDSGGTAVQLGSVADLPPAAGSSEAAASYAGGKELARRPKAEVEVWSGPSGDTLQTGQVPPSVAEEGGFIRIFVASRDGTLDNVRGNPDDPHRVEAWKQYLDSGRTLGYAHWARVHDVNQTQASKAAGAVTAYQQTLGWGRTEVTVHVEIDGVQYARRLDIADNDPAVLKGVEVKTGYQTLTTGKNSNEWEIKRDKVLVENGLDIQWVFRDVTQRPSENLLKALDEANIKWTIES
jgi:hypothetical protein